jgi:WhiB family redox-sensing transcriptional regulator
MSVDWLDWALCRAEDPELWFPPKAGPAPKAAREVCERCAVRMQCLERALALEDGLPRDARFGVWAGTSPQERFLLWRAGQRVAV